MSKMCEVQLNADDILKCYDTFEWLVERLFDTMQSVFYRVSQIDDALRISVHIVAEADLQGLMSERPELNVQQEDENEWFIGCILFRMGVYGTDTDSRRSEDHAEVF